MAKPDFVAAYPVDWSTGANSKVSPSFDVQAQDVLVVMATSEDQATTLTSISGGGLTWMPLQSVVVSSYCTVYAWGAIAPATTTLAITVTVTASDSVRAWGFNVLHWRKSDGIGASAKANASGAPSVSLTTTGPNSAICLVSADWTAATGSRTWRTVAGPATELHYAAVSGAYTTYGAYHADAGAVGAKAVGLSAPAGQKFSIIAVEVLGSASSSTPVSGSDSATLSESTSTDAAASRSDAAGLGETAQIGVAAADSATFSESAVTSILITVTDAAALVEGAAAIGQVRVDASALGEAAAVNASPSLADTAALTEQVAIGVAAADVAGFSETSQLTQVSGPSVSDTVNFVDAAAVGSSTTRTDAAGFTETATLAVFVQATDQATLADTTLQQVPKAAVDSAVVTETSAVTAMAVERVRELVVRPVFALSREYLHFWVDGVTGTGETVEVAFTAADGKPVEGDWEAASWGRLAVDGADARVLVGPGGAVPLASGIYAAWVRVTADEERPVLRPGLVSVI